MVALLARLALVVSLLGAWAGAVQAQDEGVLILHTTDDAGVHTADLRAWVAMLAQHVAHVTGTRALDVHGCWPEEPTCAAQYLTLAHASRILLVRVLWDRASRSDPFILPAPLMGGVHWLEPTDQALGHE